MLQAEPSVVADVQRRYGDHLYAKHDYDAAMAQYVATIGFLEPSYIIRCAEAAGACPVPMGKAAGDLRRYLLL